MGETIGPAEYKNFEVKFFKLQQQIAQMGKEFKIAEEASRQLFDSFMGSPITVTTDNTKSPRMIVEPNPFMIQSDGTVLPRPQQPSRIIETPRKRRIIL